MIIYGLMKFIEQIPERYDKMIGFLTLGGHKGARRRMLSFCKPGAAVLDIGCGTGSFLIEAAKRGATGVGIDASRSMLEVFRKKIEGKPSADRLTIVQHSATMVGQAVGDKRFDLITASLMLGELPPLVLTAVLEQLPGLLAPGGRVLIADELWPENRFWSALYSIILAITFVPNFILTRTMIRPVKDLPEKLRAAGLRVVARTDYHLGVVSLLEAVRADDLTEG